jgi:hypothetical protein
MKKMSPPSCRCTNVRIPKNTTPAKVRAFGKTLRMINEIALFEKLFHLIHPRLALRAMFRTTCLSQLIKFAQ